MAPANVLCLDDAYEERFTRWDITGHQFNRHLLSQALTETPDVVADVITFPPGFVHHMHRHFHADQFMVPLEGWVEFRDASKKIEKVGRRQLRALPRGRLARGAQRQLGGLPGVSLLHRRRIDRGDRV